MHAHEKLTDEDSLRSSHAVPAGVGVQGGLREISETRNIKIGKTAVSKAAEGPVVLAEVFTMTIGSETIELLPFKNWSQLDAFKWRARGILPGTPAGLEITWDHLKIADQTVSPWDSDGCAKVEGAFNEWLELGRRTLELEKAKAQAAAAQTSSKPMEDQVVHFKLDLSNLEQPRLKCLEGNETIKVVALNQLGLNALIEQGLMRKPKTLKVGALHNWVELDGQMFRFKEDPNEAQELEKVLNEKYVAIDEPGATHDVAIFPNPASPSGFDIQFPATAIGVIETRKRHLNEETVQLLQDQERCRVLRRAITAKFAPPDLIFRQKTPAGGESNLDPGPDSTVVVEAEDGQKRTIDLSQPVSLLDVGVRELTAIFNHPAVNRRARLAATANQH